MAQGMPYYTGSVLEKNQEDLPTLGSDKAEVMDMVVGKCNTNRLT